MKGRLVAGWRVEHQLDLVSRAKGRVGAQPSSTSFDFVGQGLVPLANGQFFAKLRLNHTPKLKLGCLDLVGHPRG